MRIRYKKPFAQFVKKSKKPLQLAIEDEVMAISKTPCRGEQKIGDLKNFFIYKFRFNTQQYLIAYKYSQNIDDLEMRWIDFYKIGSHENFYIELKKFVQQN